MRSIYDQEMREIQRDSIHMCNLAAETLQDVMDAVRRRDFNVVDRVLEQDYTCLLYTSSPPSDRSPRALI